MNAIDTTGVRDRIHLTAAMHKHRGSVRQDSLLVTFPKVEALDFEKLSSGEDEDLFGCFVGADSVGEEEAGSAFHRSWLDIRPAHKKNFLADENLVRNAQELDDVWTNISSMGVGVTSFYRPGNRASAHSIGSAIDFSYRTKNMAVKWTNNKKTLVQ